MPGPNVLYYGDNLDVLRQHIASSPWAGPSSTAGTKLMPAPSTPGNSASLVRMRLDRVDLLLARITTVRSTRSYYQRHELEASASWVKALASH